MEPPAKKQRGEGGFTIEIGSHNEEVSDAQQSTDYVLLFATRLPEGIRAMKISCEWRDQDFGNCKAQIRMRLMREENEVAQLDLFGRCRANGETGWHPVTRRVLPEFDVGNAFLSKMSAGDNLQFEYVVGGGGGHEIHVRNFVVLGTREGTKPHAVASQQQHITKPDAPAASPPCTNTGLVALFGNTLMTKHGEKLTAEVLVGKSVIMVYFSAHWCPPCRGFTPTLADAYRRSASSNSVEIVFVSSDRDEAGFNTYYSTMPWAAIPFKNRALQSSLGKRYGVSGIPCLVILDGLGQEITRNGRAEYTRYLRGEQARAGG